MALREINLIPFDILARRQRLRHVRCWTGFLAISLMSIFGFHLYQVNNMPQINVPASNLGDIEKDLAANIKEIKKSQEELKKLNQQYSDLKAVTFGQSFSRLLFRLAQAMDSQTWLKSLKINTTNQKKPAELLITGYSVSNGVLGYFLNRLSLDSFFENAILNYAKESLLKKPDSNKKGSVKQMEFEIQCKLSGR